MKRHHVFRISQFTLVGIFFIILIMVIVRPSFENSITMKALAIDFFLYGLHIIYFRKEWTLDWNKLRSFYPGIIRTLTPIYSTSYICFLGLCFIIFSVIIFISSL